MLVRNAQLASLDLVAEADLLAVQSGVALRRAALLDARRARLERSDALVFAAYGARAEARLAGGALPLKVPAEAGEALDRVHEADAIGTSSVGGADADARGVVAASVLERRADVRAARERRAAAEVRAALARATLRPTVSLEGGWAAVTEPTSLGGSGAVPGVARGWSAGLMVSAPLVNRRDRGRVLVAEAEEALEALRVQAAENVAREEVRAAARALRFAGERRQVLEEAARLAARQFDAERRRWELGLGDAFRVLQAEEVAVQAELEAVRARHEVLRAQARHALATGTLRGLP
jgi:outer membrane protein TolC